MYSRPTRTFHAHKLQTPAPSSTPFPSDFAVKTRTETPPPPSALAVLPLAAPPSRRPLDRAAPSVPPSSGSRRPLRPAVLRIAPPPPSRRPRLRRPVDCAAPSVPTSLPPSSRHSLDRAAPSVLPSSGSRRPSVLTSPPSPSCGLRRPQHLDGWTEGTQTTPVFLGSGPSCDSWSPSSCCARFSREPHGP
ncbi:hypothetical protein GUJ93_ZPchr0004g39844 [Zizania palustris]|uniref:Uncharacterized protein n=1 Tax=Zizania palustris TaxID=103762 RepID=A0A8J5VN56_ZIZPA|nr:hypothetical protein GUJ93_ZPchr0004g39844 [Zizania palustris]